ncbi:MAG: PhoX family phosphatase [Hyphomicrobiaceae bacterium TMED74]|nr:transcriptional initiation protein Tat [Filomicrobium sp.]MAI48930.1 transcriptional initiation protein Tat [Filomicrobium sp.]RPG34626.1 MAG: PhoX family phosphatase [Hyphomicrobiaceae bacterium TMED74]RPG45380.1 MAG: PhoX family phosphatase [Hyphomicrobiaceae bacterium TMED74]
MSKIEPSELSFDEFDEIDNSRRQESDFDVVVEEALSRRGFMGGVLAFGTASFLMGTSALTPAHAKGRFAFEAVPASTEDTIVVPKGYKWQTLVNWGDPLWSKGAAFDQTTRGTGESQETAFGDNNDGMALFSAGEGRMVLAVNNEYTNRSIMYGNRETKLPETADDVRKGKAAHGVSVFEVKQADGKWSVVKDSSYNRRITADSPMDLTGPAAGNDMLKTAADPTGTKSLGTWNNCGNGRTPWGTYLACEENFNGYFSSSDEDIELPEAFKRYGIKTKDWGYAWGKFDDRFDISKNPNEPNRAGYIVEIDPLDPKSTPKKRTGLGRFKHENAEVDVAANGKIVVYMGDDERGEYLYKFVSSDVYVPGGDTSTLLDKGTLYAAKFNAEGKGEWLALTPETTGMASAAEICIHTRMAALAVKATTMDRPEWVASNPKKAEVYCALTNNKNRGKKANKGGDPMPVDGPNPREANKYGQIVRWRPEGGDHTATGFTWDLYVLAGNPAVHTGAGDLNAGSRNVTTDNFFNSPDGIAFDSVGMLWIQTDGKYSNKGDFEGMGNNQMLVGDPVTGEIRRFLTGPKECEVTGITFSPDRRTVFVGIQHPGEKGDSHFPDGGKTVPRSCVVAITREDGAVIG